MMKPTRKRAGEGKTKHELSLTGMEGMEGMSDS